MFISISDESDICWCGLRWVLFLSYPQICMVLCLSALHWSFCASRWFNYNLLVFLFVNLFHLINVSGCAEIEWSKEARIQCSLQCRFWQGLKMNLNLPERWILGLKASAICCFVVGDMIGGSTYQFQPEMCHRILVYQLLFWLIFMVQPQLYQRSA